MLPLLDGVSERTITEARRLAKEDEVGSFDDRLVSVQAGENAIANVNTIFESSLKTFDGALRGFPAKKILADFDGEAEPDIQAVYGNNSEVRIIRSVPGAIIGQSGFELSRPRPVEAISKYYNLALQRHGVAAVVAEGFSETLDAAHGALSLCEELGMKNVVMDDPRPLRFGCRCSRERAYETLRALSPEELAAMANSGRDTDIICHMCGKTYSFKPEELRRIGGGN